SRLLYVFNFDQRQVAACHCIQSQLLRRNNKTEGVELCNPTKQAKHHKPTNSPQKLFWPRGCGSLKLTLAGTTLLNSLRVPPNKTTMPFPHRSAQNQTRRCPFVQLIAYWRCTTNSRVRSKSD